MTEFTPQQPTLSTATALSKQDMERILRGTTDFVWITDHQHCLSHVSGSHVPPTLQLGLPWWQIEPLETRHQNWAPIQKRFAERKPLKETILFYTYPDGQGAWLEITGVPQFAPTGQLQGYVGSGRFVTERIEDEERLQQRIRMDPLTDLPNRQALHETLFAKMVVPEPPNANELTASSSATPTPTFSLLFVDLDSFHRVNNSLGHLFGDKILISLAERLAMAIEGYGEVYRYGGDEFVVITEFNISAVQLDLLANSIIRALAEPLMIEKTKLTVTVSIGIANFPVHGKEPITLIKAADTAMYHAKLNGKNGFMCYLDSMHAVADRRLMIESLLREALANQSFQLLFQPQYEVLTKKLCGFEALLRMKQSDPKNAISPAEFIPIAEDTRLIVPIGYWIVEEVCRTIKQWLTAGFPPVRFAINLSVVQLETPDIVDNIVQRVKAAGIPAALIEIEITESCMIEDLERALARCQHFAAAGFNLAIDDFGTGYSSLSVLSRMPAKKIKIDRSFVVNSTRSPDDAQIARAIVMLGKNLNRTVLAEGVETIEQFEFLKAVRCDSIQGFGMGGLFSRETISQALHPKVLK